MSEVIQEKAPAKQAKKLNIITQTGDGARPMTGNEAIARGAWESG